MNKEMNYWLDKKAKIEILKDGKRLIYTATIMEIDTNSITFLDRDGVVYSFNRQLIKEMAEINGGDPRG